MRSDQLPLVTLDGRHAGELLAHPCDCGRPQCTLGGHIWRATQDMRAGPRAQNTDPKVRGTTTDTSDHDPDPDPVLHLEYLRLVTAYWRNARQLADFVARLRPDRILRNPPTLADPQDWCRNHLDAMGVAEPVYRDHLCRWCYDVRAAEGHEPPQSLLVRRYRGERLRAEDITSAIAAIRPTRAKRGKKRKAS